MVINYFNSRSPWSAPSLSPFIQEGQSMVFRPHQYVYHQGEASKGLYYLHRGVVRVAVLGNNGTEKLLDVLEAPATMGETSAVDGEPNFASAMAMVEAEVYMIPREEIPGFLRRNPEIAYLLSKSLAYKMRSMALQIESLTFFNAPARLAMLLLDLAVREASWIEAGGLVRLPITHQELAEALGTSRVTVTTVLNHLEQLGIIEKGHRSLIIRDRARLKEIAHDSATMRGLGCRKEREVTGIRR